MQLMATKRRSQSWPRLTRVILAIALCFMGASPQLALGQTQEAGISEAADSDAFYCQNRKLGYWFYCEKPKEELRKAAATAQPPARERLAAIGTQLEELKAKKDLQTVVLLIVMYRITREMYFSRDRKKIVIIDEAWDLLSGGATAEFIEAGYRRARKYKGSFMSATQGIDDYYRNPAARAALDNSDWMFLLRQKPESIEMLDRKGRLTMDEPKKRLLNSLRTEAGVYSELYISSPVGEGVARNILDPATHLLFSNKLEDNAPIDELRAQGLSIDDAITELLRRRGHAV